MSCKLCGDTGLVLKGGDSITFKLCPNGCAELLQRRFHEKRNAEFKAKHGRDMTPEDIFKPMGMSIVQPWQEQGRTVLQEGEHL